jgi:hypothetical protein
LARGFRLTMEQVQGLLDGSTTPAQAYRMRRI